MALQQALFFTLLITLSLGALCPNSIGPFTMDMTQLAHIPIVPLPYKDIQFTPSPTYRCTVNTDCRYGAYGPGRELFVQDLTIEGDIANNLVVSFNDTNCRPNAFKIGLAWSSTDGIPLENPLLVARDASGRIISSQVIQIQRGYRYLAAEAIYRGRPAASFEIMNNFTTIATRFAADDIEFCCQTSLCYDPCFPTGTVQPDNRCLCAPGRSGPNSVLNGWVYIADNCNTPCIGADCLNIPSGQGAPSMGPCGPCTQFSSGNWQNPYNGVCTNVQTAGVTNGDSVINYIGEPSCTPCLN
jgi:hypothetical protein